MANEGSKVTFRETRGWVSNPPGLAIIADADGVMVHAGENVLAQMKTYRADNLVVVDEAFVALMTPQGPSSGVCSLAEAEAWARGLRVQAHDGPLNLGEPMLAAWEWHRDLNRAARSASSGLVVPLRAKAPTLTVGRGG